MLSSICCFLFSRSVAVDALNDARVRISFIIIISFFQIYPFPSKMCSRYNMGLLREMPAKYKMTFFKGGDLFAWELRFSLSFLAVYLQPL